MKSSEHFESTEHSDSNHGWAPCVPGTLSEPELSFSERLAKRRADVFSLALIYVSGVLIFGSLILTWSSRPMRGEALAPSKLNCEQVRQHLVAYSEMKVCNCELRAAISSHLRHCPKCDLVYHGLAGNHVAQAAQENECDFEVTRPNQWDGSFPTD